MSEKNNPFDVTKASDFTDEQINNYWVDYPSSGFLKIIKPKSAMPMLIRGGKGSGKTHLMRHYSFSLQKMRKTESLLEQIKTDGYLGIYMVCDGINASRFSGKGQGQDTWNTVFAYYMDIWLSQIVLKTIIEIYDGQSELGSVEQRICSEIFKLFDKTENNPTTLLSCIDEFVCLQKDIDLDVNNCAIQRKLEIKIKATSPVLIFDIPKILVNNLPSMKKVLFVYLIDEFENLNEEQQKYVNSLVRQRRSPVTFKIGGRKYGFRTALTLSANEDIKEDSEYEGLELDEYFRGKKEYSYKEFVEQLCKKRLLENNFKNHDTQFKMNDFFECIADSKFEEKSVEFIYKKYSALERPYIVALRKKLEKGLQQYGLNGVQADGIDLIIQRLAVEKFLLIEKFNIFLFYQSWFRGENLNKASMQIYHQCKQFILKNGAKDKGDKYSKLFYYWKEDLLAQLLRECDRKNEYLGFDTFVELSHGLPRNLLVILKKIFQWSEYNGEKPFDEGVISVDSQKLGVQEASEWFYSDARGANGDGKLIRDGISNLGELFRSCLFSDKPAEVSCASFSYDPSAITTEAQRIIDLAVQWSLLILDPKGRKDKNSMRIDRKYILNKMLSPIWQLPVARRGTIALRPEEINALFDTNYKSKFKELLNKRTEKMKAPFKIEQQPGLFSFLR